MAGRRDVILYELNEVPWEIVDFYARERPGSALARLLGRAQCLTTVDDDPVYLQPWRTWPTFHTGLFSEDHKSMELGQDPETFRGETIWDAAEAAGLKIGLFGPLQSWPARQPRHGGFWVPDTFARTPQTVPAGLSRFQEFNLSMTAENTFSANAPLNAKRMAAVGMDLVTKGLTPRSGALLARQVLRERKDERWKAARPMAQVLPAFDLYWRLHRRTKPNLSIFFTNHVAGMMHRYWGDAVPGYSDQYDYDRDDVFGKFLFESLDLFDAQLARIMRHVERSGNTVLIIASSMGQGAIYYSHIDKSYVLRDADRLTESLGLPRSEPGLAMYPRYALQFATPADAEAAAAVLAEVRLGDEPFFTDAAVEGRTVSAAVAYYAGDDGVAFRGQQISLEALGFAVEERLGGGNTAHHIPQGIWIAAGAGIAPDSSRAEFSVLEAKPRILEILGAGSRAPQAAGAAA